jgi:acetyl esterase/lipase
MTRILIGTMLLCFAALFASAQSQTVKVWPDGPPGAKADPNYREETPMDKGIPRVVRVTDPVLLVYLPAPEKANGAAVVICPGGGYGVLAVDHEGYAIAAWLNDMGVAGIVLKYRLPSDAIMEDKSVGPLQDAQEAIRIVRRRADEWHINPKRIGIIGFSAGGHLASTASTHFADQVYKPVDATSARPDFSILLYPVISMEPPNVHMGSRNNLLGRTPSQELIESFSNERRVTADTPPTFLVHSEDDNGVPVGNSISYFEALVKNKVPAELHIYQKGGHGYGLAKGRGTESTWPEACRAWLKQLGMLER